MRKRHRKGRFEQSERTLGRAAETGRPTPKAKARIDRCDDIDRRRESAAARAEAIGKRTRRSRSGFVLVRRAPKKTQEWEAQVRRPERSTSPPQK